MTKEEALRILLLLSQIEGYVAGKLGAHSLPDYMTEELSDVCELLASKVSS